jgi:hypothetical protein
VIAIFLAAGERIETGPQFLVAMGEFGKGQRNLLFDGYTGAAVALARADGGDSCPHFSRRGKEVIACRRFFGRFCAVPEFTAISHFFNVLFRIPKSELTANRIVRPTQVLVLSVPGRFAMEFRTFVLISANAENWRTGSSMATFGCSPS